MKTRDDGLAVWLPMGLLVGSSSAILVGLINGESNLPVWLKDYDSIIGAIATIAVGFISFLLLWKQILQVDSHREDDRRNRQRAARAMLSLGLDQIMQTSDSIIEKLVSQLPPGDKGSAPLVPNQLSFIHELKSPPFDALDRLTKVIETAPTSVALQLQDITTRIQYYHARLSLLIPAQSQWSVPGISMWTVRQCIMDFVDLQVRTSRCFPYARGRSEHIPNDPISLVEITNAMFRIHLDENGDTWARLEKKYSLEPN